MSNLYKGLFLLSLILAVSLLSLHHFGGNENKEIKFKKITSSSSPKASFKMKKEREEYFFNLLRDPATDKIPADIRNKELTFAKNLHSKNSLQKSSALTWAEAGPKNVGGRTRALAVDVTNSNTIIAGGAAGGIWKSIDNGATWNLKSSHSSILSVTSIAQDPRPGQTNNWYYTSGEYRGSGPDYGYRAFFTGDGIYKSTDNGETWSVLPGTLSSNPTQWESFFDWVSKIAVSSANGNVFVAANGFGIFRSTDGGASFTKVLGDPNHHVYSDVDVASNGTVLAILAGPFQGVTPAKAPGLYKSTDNGGSWTNIPLNNYPATAQRSVVRVAPSNPNVGYLLTFTGTSANNREDLRFYKINISNGTSEERSSNLPDFSSQEVWDGYINTQTNYNMTLAVKPDNENFVMIAGTCMFRSTDGFATKPNDKAFSWIGGYSTQQTGLYPNFHSDVHSFSFDPNDPKKMWWGHDGGLTYTTDINNSSYQVYFPWESKNNGYNVTQFYHISISNNAGDNRIMGGCQDNGTPYFIFNGNAADQILDASSGDGAFSYFGDNFAYTSAQNGAVIRLKYDLQNNPVWNGWSQVSPSNASNQLFINPFEIDPNNEDVMYYPSGNEIWRNDQLGSIPDGSNGTTQGWTTLTNLTVPSGYAISAISVSRTPANILYFAGSSFQEKPKIYKLTNSATSTNSATEISIPEAAEGAYVHNIAINPDNSNEILVVMSNYNIVGLYHSDNGGQSYSAVEGNLAGSEQNPGPSLRAATILPGIGYFLATSIGVYSANQLNGNSTAWVQEGDNVIGNVIVNHITSRKSDGRVVAGTHGRGAFVGSAGGGSAAVLNVSSNELHIDVYPGQSRATYLRISNPGGAGLSFNVSATNEIGKKRPIAFAEGTAVKSYPLSYKMSLIENKSLNIGKKQTRDLYNSFGDINKAYFPAATEELILDDGNAMPDGFFGPALQGYYFYWANRFDLDKDFALEKVRYFMKTESASTNTVAIEVQSANGTTLYSTVVNTDLSAAGKWYEFVFPQQALSNLTFENGDSFYLIITSQTSTLTFPAAYDDDGVKAGSSFWAYYEISSGYFSGWATFPENAAWLVRAVGNSGGIVTNQPPVASAQVTPNPAQINQTINFNGSNSYDPDGQITSFSWDFGDGQGSTEANTTHSYSQAGQFTYGLTVTDNNGATNLSSGQITVTDGGGANRFTINPATGNVSPGAFQDIQILFNSQGLQEGNYQAHINVNSNGGSISIPITIFVSTSVDVNSNPNAVYSYKLEQNYPNPFNPSTKIRWQLPEAGKVVLKVFNLNGEEVATLVNEFKSAGIHESIFDASAAKKGYTLSSGVYIYRLESNAFIDSKKFILIK